jgi:hypothetical protein
MGKAEIDDSPVCCRSHLYPDVAFRRGTTGQNISDLTSNGDLVLFKVGEPAKPGLNLLPVLSFRVLLA